MNMNFKAHLLIVSCISLAVALAWSLLPHEKPPAPQPVQPVVKSSPYAIIINHASWGLNCKSMRINGSGNSTDSYYSPGSVPKIRVDNVLLRVSELCNGKLQCDFEASPETLGDDPMPECGGKQLEIEYRCFSYDRPWQVRANGRSVSINCDRPETP